MRFNPGLQARLLLAFGAVAVLAVATNLLAERTVRVVVERVWSAPATAPTPPVVAAAVPEPVAAESVPEPQRQSRPVRRADYAAAIEDYERAVQSRIASADPAAQRALEASTASLDRQFVQIQSDLGDSRRTLRKNLAQDRDVLHERAAAAITQSDQRREAQSEYARVADELADVTRKKMDGAWRFLGRVIARQQMVELRDRTEELRRLVARQSAGESVIPALARLEAAIGSLLPAAPTKPAKAGAEPDWDERIRASLATAATIRERLDALERATNVDAEQRAVKVAAALARVAALPASIEVMVASPSSGAVKARKGDASVPTGTVAPSGTEAALAVEPTMTPVENATVDAADAERAARSRALLIGLSIGVVLLTLGVTLLTVRSLMMQIRRLIDGSRRVARGEVATVAPGGIRELDLLAGEFNAMSVQLAAARAENERHQHDLESRVVERTTQLHFQAAHDPLTLLPNRRELSRLLERALLESRGDRRIGVFLVDLDNFKVVNDGMGHAFGDKVLVAMAERLRSLTPPGGFAARLGGDEFTVVAADSDVDAIRATGWNLVRAFQQPLNIDGRELILSVSVGASLCPDHAADADGLLRAADSALFRAKALGRSQLALFSPEMLDAAESRFSTEQSLRRAVERGEFELVYQPEVDSVSFEVTSVEALLRWRLPDGRLVSPGEFLAVAEESGLITEISEWVLREAVAAAGRWYRGGWKEVRVAINVSSRQLVDLGFVPRLAELLAKQGLPPSAIEIELTENVLQTGAHTVTTLQGLRQLGVATALDDFGTGYSSLASLEQLPLTRVKLDRSLVASIDSSSRSAAISRAILGLCDGLGLAVTAEGIERLPQFDVLMRYQPLTLQGFLLSRPLPESKVLEARAAMPGHLTGLLLSGPDDTQFRPALAAAAVVGSARTG